MYNVTCSRIRIEVLDFKEGVVFDLLKSTKTYASQELYVCRGDFARVILWLVGVGVEKFSSHCTKWQPYGYCCLATLFLSMSGGMKVLKLLQ